MITIVMAFCSVVLAAVAAGGLVCSKLWAEDLDKWDDDWS